jgi:hypothetical protein
MNYQYLSCNILVPKSKDLDLRNIASGSGLVGVSTENVDLIYYEGNVYGAENLREINERILVAAGRLMTRYPTTAFSAYPADFIQENFCVVGTVDLIGGRMVVNITDQLRLDGWSNKDSNQLDSSNALDQIDQENQGKMQML